VIKIPVLIKGTGKFARGTTQIGHIVTRLFRLINISSAAPLTPGRAAQTNFHVVSPERLGRELQPDPAGREFQSMFPRPCRVSPVYFPPSTPYERYYSGGE